MTFDQSKRTVDQLREYLRGDITAADALAVLEAETGPDGKARATVIEAATARAEQLAPEPLAQTDPPSPVGADGIPVLTQPDLGAAVTPEVDPVTPDAEPVTPAGDEQLAAAVVALASSTVQPHRYEGDQWAVGQRAPQSIVRAMSRAGQYGSPRPGDLSPGERGDIVVQAGDTITAAVRRILG